MSLRQLKSEIEALPNFKNNLEQLKKHWLKPIKSNTNQHLPFLQQLTPAQKEKFNTVVAKSKQVINNLEDAEFTQNKFKSYIRYLIELKLATLNNNKTKAKFITNYLLQDQFLNLKNTIVDIKSFQTNVKTLEAHHHEIGEYLGKHLNLEQALVMMELPHWRYLVNLLQTAKDHQRIIRDLGRHFLNLAGKGHKED